MTYNQDDGVELCEPGAVMYTSNIRFHNLLDIYAAFGIPNHYLMLSPYVAPKRGALQSIENNEVRLRFPLHHLYKDLLAY